MESHLKERALWILGFRLEWARIEFEGPGEPDHLETRNLDGKGKHLGTNSMLPELGGGSMRGYFVVAESGILGYEFRNTIGKMRIFQ